MKIQEKHINAILFLVPLIVLGFIWREVIFFDRIFFDGDILLNYYPFFEYFSKDGPLVIQEILSGFPAYVTVSGIWFYPFNDFVLKMLDPIFAYKYMTAFNMVLTYVFTYAYTKKISFSTLTAILVSMVFTFSGQIMLWSSTLLMTNGYFLLPLAMYLIEQAMERGGKYRFSLLGLTGVALGMGWLSSQPQFVTYTHFLVFAYLIFRFFPKNVSWSQISKTFVYVGLPFVVSFAIGFQQIVATLAFKSVTARATGVTIQEVFFGSYLPQDLLHYLLPFWAAPFQTGSPNLYIGILPFLFLIFSFFLIKKIRSNLFRLYLAVFSFCFLASVKYSPVAFLLHTLPVFDSFREAPRIMFIGNFSAAILVGMSIDYVLSNRADVSRMFSRYILFAKKLIIYVFVLLIIFVSAVKFLFVDRVLVILNEYFLINIYPHTSKLPVEHYYTVIDQELNNFLNQLYIGNPHVLATFVLTILTLFLASKVNISKNKFLAVSILLVALDFSLVYADHYQSIPRSHYISEPQTAKFIKEKEVNNSEPYRIFSFLPSDTIFRQVQVKCGNDDPVEVLTLQKELMVPNLNILYGLDAVDGYDQFTPKHISLLLASIGSERTPIGNNLSAENIPTEDKAKKLVLKKEVLQMMNTKYVVSNEEIRDVDFKEVYLSTVGECGTVVRIYELADYWPRYYLSYGSQRIPVPVTYTKEGMIFDVEAEKKGVLYVGNTWLPSWEAYMDSKSLEISKANGVYMSVPVVEGKYQIIFSHNPSNRVVPFFR